jgi:rhodanese-related sulfurtransferase
MATPALQTPPALCLEFDPLPADAARAHAETLLRAYVDAADLAEDLLAGAPVVVIDARKPEAYAQGHVPGAINFPHRSMDAASLKRLPRAALYITYCDGIGCNASTKGALKLARHGYPVKELIGGLDWWVRDGLPVVAGTAAGSLTAPGVQCAC